MIADVMIIELINCHIISYLNLPITFGGMGLLPCVEVAWVFALEIKFSNSILSENAARRGEHRLTLWYIFLSGWRINDSAKTMTP